MKCGDCLKYTLCKHILSGGLSKSEEACEVFADKNKWKKEDFIYVTRCVNCKYLDFKDFQGYCSRGELHFISLNDYCSRGERRDDRN